MVEKIIYDTVATGTSATQHSFFTHTEGTDGIATTNLPEKNKVRQDMTVAQIVVQPSADLDTTDYVKLTEDAALRIYIDGAGYVIEIPLFMTLSSTELAGFIATAADRFTFVNHSGQGYHLDEPFVIPADTTFNVYIELGSAFATSTDITVVLKGPGRGR